MSLSVKIKTLKNLSDEIDFGKYKGKLVSDVLAENPKYLEWMMNNTNKTEFNSKLKKKIREACDEKETLKYFDEMYMGSFVDEFWKD